MKNRIITFLCVILSLIFFLTSCSNTANVDDTDLPDSSEANSEQLNDEETDIHEAEPVETVHEESVPVSIYENDDFSLYLHPYIKRDTGENVAYITADVYNDSIKSIRLSHIEINGNTHMGGKYLSAPEFIDEIPQLPMMVNDIGWDGIKGISFDVEVTDTENNSILAEHGQQSFPDGLTCKKTTAPFMGAKAEKQVLFEDDKVKIRMNDMGTYDPYAWSTSLCFEVFIENKSSMPMSPDIPYLVVNGIACKVYSQNRKTEIAPGEVAFFDVEEPEYRLEPDLCITSINSVSLLIKIDKSEKISDFIPGGKLYPITLSESGEETHRDFTDEVLFEGNGLKILKLVPTDEEEQRYYFPIAIINTENVTKAVNIRELSENGGHKILIISDECIPPKATIFEKIQYDEETAGKEHTYQMQVLTSEGSTDTAPFTINLPNINNND